MYAMSNVKVSIVIVDYYKGMKVLENVKGALSQKGEFNLRVVVYDNSCDNGNYETYKSLSYYDNVEFIKSDKNIGYTAACNLVANSLDDEYIFLVNPDISWPNDNIIENILFRFLKDESIGIIGTKQINEDGSIPNTVRSFPTLLSQVSRRTFLSKIFKKCVSDYEVSGFDYTKSSYVDWLQSSFVAIRRTVWGKVNGLDSRYFLFMSDPDICYKTWKSGYKVFYDSSITINADGKRCSDGGFFRFFKSKALRVHVLDSLKYYKNYLKIKDYPKRPQI